MFDALIFRLLLRKVQNRFAKIPKNITFAMRSKRMENLIKAKSKSPGGGIGRRVGLKHQWGNTRAGSTPALGTNIEEQKY